MSRKSDMYDKYGDIIPDGYTVSDRTKEMLNKPSIDKRMRIPDAGLDYDYNSPIELIAGNLQTRIENDAVKVVQSYGFNVDKVELEKALKYDRDQYDKGYAAGSRNVPRWILIAERLPDYLEDTLVTIQINNREPKVRSGFYANGCFHNDNGDTWNWNDPEVKAWMPLPEPYKDIDGDNE